MSVSTAPAPWSTVNKVGFGLAVFIGLANVASVFQPTPDGEVGPPFSILLVDSLLALVAIGGAIVAWRRGSRLAARLTAVVLIVLLVTALPAFFVDVPSAIKALVGAFTLLTVATCAMMLAPARTDGTTPRAA